MVKQGTDFVGVHYEEAKVWVFFLQQICKNRFKFKRVLDIKRGFKSLLL